MTTHPRRRTELTPEQRAALQTARRVLEPHFPGEKVSMYCRTRSVEVKLQLEARIRDALVAGERPVDVARREGVSHVYVYKLRGRFKGI